MAFVNDESSLLAIAVPTFFPNAEDPRFTASLDTLKECKSRGYRVVLVDGSPQTVRDVLTQAGAALVVEQTSVGKAGALRQAICAALDLEPPAKIIAFQELEKTDFVRFLRCFDPISLQGGRLIGGDVGCV